MRYLTLKNSAFALIFVISFLGFYHGDFIHTVSMSTYWNANLYDKCRGCNYLPLIYGLFYLWGLPLKFFTEYSFDDPYFYIIGLDTESFFFLYHKVLLVMLYAGSIFFTYKISKILKIGDPKISARIFALSPFVFFVIFIYSGYDIFSVFFSLIAIFLFIKKRIFWTFLAFSVAVSFKFFAIPIALSVLALLDEKLMKKILLGFLILSITFLQVFLFYKEPFFLEGVFHLFQRHSSNQNIIFNPAIFIGVGFSLWLFALQFNKRLKKYFMGQNFIYVPYISILFLFCYSPISPPWVILILPYLYLVVIKNNHQKPFLFLEIIFFFSFIILITNIWNRNIDLNLANNGIFVFLHNPNYLFKDFYFDFYNQPFLFIVGFGFFYVYFFLPFILNFFNKPFLSFKLNINQLINIRFLIPALFFLTPFITSPFFNQTNDFAKNLNSSRQFVNSNDRSDLFLLNKGSSICELLNPPYSNLEFIAMRIPFNFSELNEDISFSYYFQDSFENISESYFDNKSLYLRLRKVIVESDKSLQFCIHNNSNEDINLFVKNKKATMNELNGHRTFLEKNFPFYLYFKKP